MKRETTMREKAENEIERDANRSCTITQIMMETLPSPLPLIRTINKIVRQEIKLETNTIGQNEPFASNDGGFRRSCISTTH